MAATKVGLVTEGLIDQVLVTALLKRISVAKASFAWPIAAEDAADPFLLRKRGSGGVVDAIRRIVTVLRDSGEFGGYEFIVIILDNKTKPEQKALRKMIRGKKEFVLGIAIQEIEAWWLGDRQSTLEWLALGQSSLRNLRYGAANYKAERDKRPKHTLDELTSVSPALSSRYGSGNRQLAEQFVETWESRARLSDIEAQCPRGFGKFCQRVTNAFRQVKRTSGWLF